MTKFFNQLLIVSAVLLIGISVAGQKRNKRPVNKGTETTTGEARPTPTPLPASSPDLPAKRNERPVDTKVSVSNPETNIAAADMPYFYEFTQPKFVITKITIIHDAAGKGSLTFSKGEYDEPITEKINLSQTTLDKINSTLTSLDFLNSTENYQYEKDYSHLGNVTFRLKKDGKEREVHFNYSTNKGATELASEYRRISNQVIWMFDMNVARENQPLDAPRIMDNLESYMQRGEISDPQQLSTFLAKLFEDERIPLIARNHAQRMVKQIEKQKN